MKQIFLWLRLALVLLAGAALSGCSTTNRGFTASWYLVHSRHGKPESSPEMYVVLLNGSNDRHRFEAIHLGNIPSADSGDEVPPQQTWSGPFWLDPEKNSLLLRVNRQERTDPQEANPCYLRYLRIPAQLYLQTDEGNFFNRPPNFIRVRIDDPLPTALPDEWLDCRRSQSPG